MSGSGGIAAHRGDRRHLEPRDGDRRWSRRPRGARGGDICRGAPSAPAPWCRRRSLNVSAVITSGAAGGEPVDVVLLRRRVERRDRRLLGERQVRVAVDHRPVERLEPAEEGDLARASGRSATGRSRAASAPAAPAPERVPHRLGECGEAAVELQPVPRRHVGDALPRRRRVPSSPAARPPT